MSQLAIKGHATRGREVIELLEMLGGKNVDNYKGNDTSWYYIIKDNYIDWCHEWTPNSDFVSYTLEEFFIKFPYKIGDIVSSKYIKDCKIEQMEWIKANNKVIYKLQGMGWYNADELKLKEETIEKINIAKILKGCPQGTKLYSPICGECTLISINKSKYAITVRSNKDQIPRYFSADGRYMSAVDAECLLFPSKDQRDWSKFQRPFKAGDIVINDNNEHAFIYSGENNNYWECYCGVFCNSRHICINSKQWSSKKHKLRLATEKEKQKLFQVIKNNGYIWNTDTKTMEKLIQPIFKAGDKIRSKNKKDECFYILNVDKDRNKYILNIKGYCLEFKDQNNYELISDKLVEPKFKVGDKVRNKNNHNVVFTITSIEEDYYACGGKMAFWIVDQDKFELVPNKFDITTLKPFESKVLVRDSNTEKWKSSFWGFYDIDHVMNYPYECCGSSFAQCIPYEGNEHLLSKTDNCDEYYKTW